MDAEYARESTELARQNITQHAGMNMLSQANQNQTSVLSLFLLFWDGKMAANNHNIVKTSTYLKTIMFDARVLSGAQR
ncbi:MAG: hypothetical protein CBD08_003915 [Cellvibrionales bacterium TMED148]|nr:hypothetical protein [Porticoccaceae bacterium]RPG90986.1 MAG: hypothetical protein CBD08_003915 [Cellvibrionales bacterium TMED148]